ncbi:ATP-binding protein [Paenibacillus chartarius]|uniref:histidine kinase n=1 Tax=Paenibacillus chartarius TaxID=747481 RepID=A0ABV6DMG5_9BACL
MPNIEQLLVQNDFYHVFQPIYRFPGKSILGYEALIREFSGQNGQVLTEELRLEEIITAVCRNACEACGSNGIVGFLVRISDETVEFIISDNGEGIAADILPRVKEPFFTTKEEALGFGLSYCEIMTRKIGGRMHIQSSTEGTEVRLVFPLSTL